MIFYVASGLPEATFYFGSIHRDISILCFRSDANEMRLERISLCAAALDAGRC